MAVSGSTDFSSTALQIITDARRTLGINAEEEPLDAAELALALPFLTRMLKAWEADTQLGGWLISTLTLTLVQGTKSYLFGAGGSLTTVPFGVLSDPPVTINRGSSDIPMYHLSRGDYARIPLKTTQGAPTQWFYDRQRDNGTFYVWPAPDATAGTVTIPIRRRIMDVDASTDNLDIPPEWEQAVVDNLAVALMPTYGVSDLPDSKLIIKRAADGLMTLKMSDIANEDSSIYIEDDSYDRGGRR
jgi:hypothetical protein